MRGIKILFLVLMLGCRPSETCDLKAIFFPKPLDSALILELDDVWMYSDAILDVLCETRLSSIYLKIDSTCLHFSSEEITNSCSGIVSCGPIRRRDRFEVLVNSQNTILVEGEVATLTDIDSLFQVIYLNPDQNKNYVTKPKSSAITLKWDVRASKDTVELVIKELMIGYENSIASLYKTSSKQEACDSIISNFEKIKYDYPFNLQLYFGSEFTLGGRVPLPPPPPPLEFIE